MDHSLIPKRIAYLKEHIRLRQVFDHFGYRYRTNGNMICCWHAETNPSARLYDSQDTYWCWVCSPERGVDIVEFVIIELGLERPEIPENKRRAVAVIQAIEYLENAFNLSFEAEPWERRLYESLHRPEPVDSPHKYWHANHVQVLRILGPIESPEKWKVYADHLRQLMPLKDQPISLQAPKWDDLRCELAALVEVRTPV